VDIYYALKESSISEMIQFYQIKYSQKNSAHVLKSLIYFDDVNPGSWPVMIKESKPEWSKVKEKIEKEVLGFIKNSS